MRTLTAPPQLGQNILVIMDSIPGFLDAFHAVVSHLPQIAQKYFTLLCYRPTHFWEHSGADNPEVRHDIEKAWEADEQERTLATHCIEQAKAILRDAGVPDSHILTRSPTGEEDSLMAATTTELKQNPYTGVIICRYHEDIVNRLLQKGITDLFRQLPKVEVLALDVGN